MLSRTLVPFCALWNCDGILLSNSSHPIPSHLLNFIWPGILLCRLLPQRLTLQSGPSHTAASISKLASHVPCTASAAWNQSLGQEGETYHRELRPFQPCCALVEANITLLEIIIVWYIMMRQKTERESHMVVIHSETHGEIDTIHHSYT